MSHQISIIILRVAAALLALRSIAVILIHARVTSRCDQFVAPLCGFDNPKMRRAAGALESVGRAVVVAALYHTRTVSTARSLAAALVNHAGTFHGGAEATASELMCVIVCVHACICDAHIVFL